MKNKIVFSKPMSIVLDSVKLPIPSKWMFTVDKDGIVEVTAIEAPSGSKTEFNYDMVKTIATVN